MAEEEETREVLFPDWEGPDKTGLTIEQKSGGEIFVKEVKGESPAARSGKVYEGDQIVGATIYFDNMSSEETAELLKTLNRHKVGLKLQNKGEKSPYCSPSSTPCRSPIGTTTRFGGSSPDIILSGDDEDYRRIYTKKIKPRLKSEDLAEGVDVRTERHSSTSSDGSTITTITRRITTYTVDVPSGISEQLELSSPEFKGLRHETGDASSHIRISHGSPSGKEGAEEGVFESSNISYTGPHVSSTETQRGSTGFKTTTTTTTTREVAKERGTGLKFKEPNLGVTGGKGQTGLEISRGNGEQEDGKFQVSETSMMLRDSTHAAGKQVKIGGFGVTEERSDDTRLGDRTKVKVSEFTISHPQAKGSGSVNISNVRLGGGFIDIDTELRGGRTGGSVIAVGSETSGHAPGLDKTSMTGVDVNLTSSKLKGEVDANLPDTKGEIKVSEIDTDIPGYETEGTVSGIKISTTEIPGNVKGPEVNIEGGKWDSRMPQIKIPSYGGKAPEVSITGPDIYVEGSKSEIKIPKVKMPSFGINIPNVEGPDADINLTKENMKGPNVDIKLPKPDTEGMKKKSKGPQINMPTISGPNISISDVDVNLKAPKVKGDMDMSQQIEGDIKPAEVDIKGPDTDIQMHEGGIEIPKIKIPKFGIKPSETKGPDVDVKLPKGSIDVKAPEVDIHGPELDVKGPDAKLKGSKFQMPTVSGPKLPDWDITLKGPKIKGDADVSVPKIEGEIHSPKLDIEGPDVNIEGSKGKFKMPEFHMAPSGEKCAKLEGPNIDVSLPKPDIDLKAPEVDIKGPHVDIESPSGKMKGPKISMPTISGPSFSLPEVDFNMKAPKIKGEVDMSIPKIKGDIKTPDLDIKGPEVDIHGPKGGIQMPKIQMPSLDINVPKLEGPDVDIKLPKGGIDVKAPKVGIKGPEIDVEGPDAKLKGPKFQMPSISGPKLPDWDINLKGPKIKGDADVSVPKIEGEIQSPKLDIEGPDVNIDGSKGGFKMPKFKMPHFGGKGAKLEGPDIDVSLPKPDIDLKAPEVDIKGPHVDIESPSGKMKGPKISMPTISGPSFSLPEVDFNMKAPKIKGEVDMSIPKIKGDIKTPDLDIKGPEVDIHGPKGGIQMPKIQMPSLDINVPKLEGPDVDIKLPKGGIDVKAPKVGIKGPEIDVEGPDAKLKGPKFQMPSISGPKLPDWDISLKGPKIKGDADVSVPKIEGEIQSPKLDIEGPDVNINGSKGGFNMPKFKMPHFGGKGAKLEGPDIDVSLPKPDIDLKAPEVDIKGPHVDIESPSGKMKGPKISMPTISGPSFSLPEVDFNMKAPKIKGEVDMSIPKIKGDIKTPDLDIKGPEVDIHGPKGGIQMPKIQMPSLDINVPKLEGPDVDIKLPKGGIDVKAPKVGIKGPEIDVEGPDAKLKGPKFQMPSISGPKLPDWDISLKGPKIKGDADVSVPKIEGEIQSPKLDIEGPDVNIDGSKGGFKMPKFKMPHFGGKGAKLEGPDIDVSLPKPDIDLKAPEVDIKGPHVDIESPSGKMKGPKISMPTISGPSFSLPEVDFNMKAPKIKGEVDMSIPKIKGDIKTPDLDIKGPEVDIHGPKGGIQMPKIQMPSLDINVPKLEGPDVDIKLPKGGIDVKAPKVGIKGPEIDVEGPDAKLKGPKFQMPSISGPKLPDWDISLKGPKIKGDADMKGPKYRTDADVAMSAPTITVEGGKTGVTFPKFKGPKFGMKSPEKEGHLKTPTFTAGSKVSKTEVGLPDTEASLDAPDININVKGKKGKFKLAKGKAKAKTPNVHLEAPAVDLDLETPDIHVKGTKAKKTLFGKLNFPDVEFDIKSPKLKGDGSLSEGLKSPDLDLPSASLNAAIEGSGTDTANVSLQGPDVKLKPPNIKMSNVKGGAEIHTNVSGDTAIGGLQYSEGTVTFSKGKIPKFGIALPQMEGQESGENRESGLSGSGGINIQSPSISCQTGSQNIKVPSPEVRHSEGKVKVKVPKLFGKSKAKGSSAGDLQGPDVELSGSGNAGKVSQELSVHTGELVGGNFELEGEPKLSVSTKGKSASLDFFKKSRHWSSSLSDEGGLAASSPSGHLEAEGGDISLDLGGSKVKGKKGKLKFGTFGGFGSKSKGSYEVSLGEDNEARVEGSTGVSLPSKKSRLSSSSSSDSGSRGGFKLPKVELNVSPKND
uniref:neuroblast differentiation-associated protein AHNAK isoform X2 n=1 Tax=Monopterus albus TaxID=43700 RepID=UPI0009B4B5A6|nr:neuroblast differentiation-associated protein AHNAK isoform X2 [Monopterus albus]